MHLFWTIKIKEKSEKLYWDRWIYPRWCFTKLWIIYPAKLQIVAWPCHIFVCWQTDRVINSCMRTPAYAIALRYWISVPQSSNHSVSSPNEGKISIHCCLMVFSSEQWFPNTLEPEGLTNIYKQYLKIHFLKKKLLPFDSILTAFVPTNINEKPTLLFVMARGRTPDNQLSEPMMTKSILI